jgi:DNA polymerase-3 subunit delta
MDLIENHMKISTSSINSFLQNIPSNTKLVLLYGPDSGLITQRSQLIKKNYLGEKYDESQYIQIFENSLKENPDKLIEEAFSVSLFGENKKLIILREAKDFLTKIIKDYINKTDQNTLVVIQAEDLSPSSSLRKLAEGEDMIAAIPCYLDNQATLKQYIMETLNKEGYKIDSPALAYLLDNLGNDREISAKELEKLMLYKYKEKNIKLEDVENLVVNNASVFLDKLIYAFFNKNYIEAYKNLLILLEENHVVVIVRSLINHTNRLIYIKESINLSENIDVALKSLRPPVFFTHVDSFKRQVSLYSLEELYKILELFINIEVDSKNIAFLGEIKIKHAILNPTH